LSPLLNTPPLPAGSRWARRLSRARNLVALLLLGLLLIDGLVGVLTWQMLGTSRVRYDDKASTQVQNLAQVLYTEISGQINVIDRSLQAVINELERGRVDPLHRVDVDQLLAHQLSVFPILSAMRVLDAQGYFIHGAADAQFAGSMADRDYFVQLRSNPGQGLVISDPIKSRLSGEWVVILARAYRAPGRGFAGVVVATLPLAQLNARFAAIASAPSDSFVLFNDRQLSFITRYPLNQVQPGDTRSSSGARIGAPALLEALARSRHDGRYIARAVTDGIERNYAYRCMDSQPFCVLVGMGREAYLTSWRHERRIALGSVSLLLLLSLGLWALIYVGWARQQRSLADLHQAYQDLKAERRMTQTIVQASPIAIYTRDLQGVITSFNPAAERLIGIPQHEAIGQRWDSLVPGAAQDMVRLQAEVLAGQSVTDREVTRQRPDGHTVVALGSLTALRDEAGAVTGYLSMAMDITARKDAEKRAHFLAYRDVLTGLPNQRLLRDRFQQAAALAEAAHHKLAMVVMDLNNFKSINDSLGHGAGDTVLQRVAEHLAPAVRESDTLSRQGGGEFTLLLTGVADVSAIQTALQEIQARLQQPVVVDSHEITPSAAMGIAIYPDDGTDFEMLMRKADAAMYRAKVDGPNLYRFFDEQMNREAMDSLELDIALRRALSRQEFELHYQPQFDLHDGTIVGFEALLRWRHPDQGLIGPGRFIQHAETSGLIVPLGDWVIQECCRQGAAWQLAGLSPLRLAVNLSALQFSQGDLEGTIDAALAQTGFDPRWLEVELTESVLIRNTEQALGTVQRLKQRGVEVSVDDFGTGYSSMSYLKRFEVDTLKIDQSFVRDLCSNTDDEAIVRAIIQMAHGLNLRTVAEGVEEEGTLHKLRELGCDRVQGYFIARPMPAGDVPAFLQRFAASQSADTVSA